MSKGAKRIPATTIPLRLRGLSPDEINWSALDIIRDRPARDLPVREYLQAYQKLGERIAERYAGLPFDAASLDLQYLAAKDITHYSQAALRAIDNNDALEVASLMKSMLEPLIAAFADQQKGTANSKYKKARKLACDMAIKTWWHEDREIPEPRSTAGCEEIAQLLVQAHLGNFTVKTIKKWLNEKGLIPDSAKRRGPNKRKP